MNIDHFTTDCDLTDLYLVSGVTAEYPATSKLYP